MRVIIVLLGLIGLILAGCGPAVFNSKLAGSSSEAGTAGGGDTATGSVQQLCAEHGMVPKADGSSDDDSTSVDDDSVDGVSADGVSSDDDSSDDQSCADAATCLQKNCVAPANP